MLTYEQVIRNGVVAWNDHKLQCQNEHGIKNSCKYAGPCVIGASLSPAVIDVIEGSSIFDDRVWNACQIQAEPHQRDQLHQLQLRHDEAVCSGDDEYVGNLARFRASLVALATPFGLTVNP